MTSEALPYTILARTPYPGPSFPPGQRARTAVTFQVGDHPRPATVWIEAADLTDEAVDQAIRAWIALHNRT
jgi:hypothetical protein